MNVLIGCEFSGVVREAFKAKGHHAVSCDLLSSEQTGEHFQGDLIPMLTLKWDMLIAFPPCTMIACSANRWIKTRKPGEIQAALDFAEKLWTCGIPKICLENPRSTLSSRIGKRHQEIQPWMFGQRGKEMHLAMAPRIALTATYSNCVATLY